jgi:hypothetical protein
MAGLFFLIAPGFPGGICGLGFRRQLRGFFPCHAYPSFVLLTFRRFTPILKIWTPSGMDKERRKAHHAVTDQRPFLLLNIKRLNRVQLVIFPVIFLDRNLDYRYPPHVFHRRKEVMAGF